MANKVHKTLFNIITCCLDLNKLTNVNQYQQ